MTAVAPLVKFGQQIFEGVGTVTRLKFCIFSVGIAFFGSLKPAVAETNIVYILDASNSMWGQIDNVAKIETARDALRTMLSNVDKDANIGLIAYGHRSKGDCNDIELLSGLGSATTETLIQRLEGLTPRGKTPIAGALAAAGDVFPTIDAVNQIILISDGIETCDGDPCAVSRSLAAAGTQTRIHAIGFDVDADAREQLRCIALAGNGIYLDAANAAGLNDAIGEVTRVAQAAPESAPEPAPEPVPVAQTVFLDDFDPDMAEAWTVNAPNPDAFIVEGGEALLLSNKPGGFAVENAENLMTAAGVLPGGNWDAVVTLTGEFVTHRDSFWFGLYRDKDNFLGAEFWTKRDCCGCANMVLSIRKSASGDQTRFDVPVRGGLGCGSFSEADFDTAIAPMATEPARIALHKRGRSYYASMTFGQDDAGNPITVETDKLTSLRPPGELSMALGIWDEGNATGEVIIMIDKVEVISLSE